MTIPSPHLYNQEGSNLGFNRAVVENAIKQSGKIERNASVPLLSLGHLAFRTGSTYQYLRRIVDRSIDPYTDIVMRKRDGSARRISAPDPILMDVQRWILHSCLHSVSSHSNSFAYQKDQSIVDCAQRHVGARWLIKLDLHDFFGGINEEQVFRIFLGRGYSRLVSLELARICTRASANRHNSRPPQGRYTVIPSYAASERGVLPQGGPTSGALANAVATPLDYALHDFGLENNLVYTRYSDDLTFSVYRDIDRKDAGRLIRDVNSIVSSKGFVTHHKKTHVVPPGARHVILGLLVDDKSVRLLPEFRRRIEMHIRGVSIFGLSEHVRHRGFRSVLSFINYVDGCIAFATNVDKDWGATVYGSWLSVLAEKGFNRDSWRTSNGLYPS